ncbi:MAG: hypothetical protein ACREIF_14330 [Chthoniobacterales bacterium]
MKIVTVSILKHPREKVWLVIRDRLPELAPYLEEIESIRVEKREKAGPDVVRLTNIWKAKPKLPAVVSGHVKPEMFSWTDHAEYDAKTSVCRWRLEPHFFSQRIHCVGTTRYQPALGGRGTRIDFEGEINLLANNLPGVPAILEGAVAVAMEAFLKTLVPKNFRKLTQAVERFLDAPSLPNERRSRPG